MTDSTMPEVERARSLLRTIGWNDATLEHVGGGTVNTTFRVHHEGAYYYLRIGPTALEVEESPSWFTTQGLQREQHAIELWSGHAQYFPETVHADFSRDSIAADWVIQTALPGEPWSALRSRLSSAETEELWRSLGTLMAELHAYVGEEFGPPEAGTGTSTWSELVRWDATGLLTDAHKFNVPVQPFQDVCDLVDNYTWLLDEITEPRLIHSDLGQRHVMVDRDADGGVRITGLIDMEFARFADAASESLFVTQSLQKQPDPAFATFLQAYGATKPDSDDRVRMLIYQLTALGWWVTDAMRRRRESEAHEILDMLTARLKEAQSL